jgi:hypothetical protein
VRTELLIIKKGIGFREAIKNMISTMKGTGIKDERNEKSLQNFNPKILRK